MPTILITGSASGFGREFLRIYAQSASNRIIAIDREETKVDQSIIAAKVDSYQLDITSSDSIKSLAKQLVNVPIDLLIHSAGVRGLVPSVENEYPSDVSRAESIDVMDMETMMKTFQINSAGTFLLVREFLPHLRASLSLSTSTPKVVIMSSRMGSISHNSAAGGAYAYRASKAALNAIVKSFSVDVPEVIFALVHPGRVETGLVKCREEGAARVEDAVQDLLLLIDGLDSTSTGTFVDRFGERIGW
jgi:NAD(P)-dependent dehydrogenase (short-subunit alcohol dehydrogenase family)